MSKPSLSFCLSQFFLKCSDSHFSPPTIPSSRDKARDANTWCYSTNRMCGTPMVFLFVLQNCPCSLSISKFFHCLTSGSCMVFDRWSTAAGEGDPRASETRRDLYFSLSMVGLNSRRNFRAKEGKLKDSQHGKRHQQNSCSLGQELPRARF